MGALQEQLPPSSIDTSFSEPNDFWSHLETNQDLSPQNPLSVFFSMAHLALDVQRAAFERMAFYMDPVWMGVNVPKGKGYPILMVPGFGATNLSLFELGTWMSYTGSKPHVGLRGANMLQKKNFQDVIDTAVEMYYENDEEPIVGFGHSAGGLQLTVAQDYLKKEFGKPIIRQVITAGSPVAFPFIEVGTEGNQLVFQSALRAVRDDPEFAEMTALFFKHLPEERKSGELISIFSESDPVVHARHTHRNDAHMISVGSGSHTGLPLNPRLVKPLGEILAA